jgi:hypothetical protein
VDEYALSSFLRSTNFPGARDACTFHARLRLSKFKASLPSIATLLGLTLSAEGRYKRRTSAEEGVESKFVREHTAASLFNRLRLRLAEVPDALMRVDSSDVFAGLASGRLVEIQGQIIGNPLKQIIDLLAALGPYYGLEIDEPTSDALPVKQPSLRNPKRSGQVKVQYRNWPRRPPNKLRNLRFRTCCES